MEPTKFTFDTVFSGDKDIASEAAIARKRQSLTQSELESLRRQAMHEGMKIGEVRALEAVAASAEDAVKAVREALARASTQVEQLRAEAATIALAAARALAGSALDAFAPAAVEDALRLALHQAIGEPRLTLRASADVAKALGPRLEEIAEHEGFDGKIALIVDPALANADCRIEWRGDGAERATAVIERALMSTAAQHFAQFQSSPISLIKE